MKISEMTIEECQEKMKLIEARIAVLKAGGAPKVLFDPAEWFERYNGGWTKIVTGLDKSVTNGYSILGDFTTSGKKDWYSTNALYLDCGIGGSRKNQERNYTLFRVNEKGEPIIIAKSDGKNWATELWEAIESK